MDLATWNSDDAVRQLEYAGVTYMEGLASFVEGGEEDDGSIVNLNVCQTAVSGSTTNRTVQAKKVLIATGSKPFRPSSIPFDGYRIFDSDTINQLSYLPSSIAITGSGIIAIEYAKIFRNLGSDVTLIIRDGSPRNALMKIGLDIDISAALVADLVRIWPFIYICMQNDILGWIMLNIFILCLIAMACSLFSPFAIIHFTHHTSYNK